MTHNAESDAGVMQRVDTLRIAANLMRERAEAETHSVDGWDEWPRRDIDHEGTCDGCSEGKRLVAAYDDPSGENEPWLCDDCAAGTDHMQSWSPAVALAVAVWMDRTALIWEARGDNTFSLGQAALDAANAYLRTTVLPPGRGEP